MEANIRWEALETSNLWRKTQQLEEEAKAKEVSDTHPGFLNRFKKRLLHCSPLSFYFYYFLCKQIIIDVRPWQGFNVNKMFICYCFYIIDYFYFKTAFSIGSDSQSYVCNLFIFYFFLFIYCLIIYLGYFEFRLSLLHVYFHAWLSYCCIFIFCLYDSH